MKKVQFIFGIHLHQPVGNFDWVFEYAYQKSYKPFIDVLKKFHELTLSGQKVGFLFGNRDFLISQKVLSPFGVDFLGEEAEIALDSQNVFLAHGHTLCLSDTDFLRYKQRIWPVFRFLDGFTPGIIANYVAEKCILKSKREIDSKSVSCLEFTEACIRGHFSSGVNVIVCGHAHRHEEKRFGDDCFYALPAWEDNKGFYLFYQSNQFILRDFTAP